MKQSLKAGILTVASMLALLTPAFLLSTVASAQQDVNPVVPSTSGQDSDNDGLSDGAENNALPATAQIQNGLCAGANLDVTTNCQSGVSEQDATDKINALIADIINIFSLVVGVVSVIMIIIGGFRYITSGGDSSNVSAAKNTILYAIIGLVIVALAQTIVRFILGRVIAA
jgi:hypothetical protein